MDIKAEQKYLIASPKKVRVVVGAIKKLSPRLAVETLPLIGKRAAEPLAKVIKQAIASAKNKGLSEDNLIFKEIQVGEGPRLKRGRPVSRGQWHPIKKRMCHIRVVLTTRNSNNQAPNSKQIQSKEISKSKIKNGTKS